VTWPSRPESHARPADAPQRLQDVVRKRLHQVANAPIEQAEPFSGEVRTQLTNGRKQGASAPPSADAS
jgi:hypothetical protein